MNNDKIDIPLVYPTQSWQIGPTMDLEYARYSAPNGAAALNDFAYVYYRLYNDQICCQQSLINTGTDSAEGDDASNDWTLRLQDTPFYIHDENGASLLSQAPVTSMSAEGQIYIFLNEFSGSDTTHIYKTRYKPKTASMSNSEYAPITRQFPNQYMIRFSAPAVAYHPNATINQQDSVMLLWAGGANNGYFYATGNIKKNADAFGDDVEFHSLANGDPRVETIPGTTAGYPNFDLRVDEQAMNFCGITPYEYEGKRGFFCLLYWVASHDAAPYPTYGYSLYDLATKAFLNDAPIVLGTLYDNPFNKIISLASLNTDGKTIIPIVTDMSGNTSNYMFDSDSPSLGSFGEWQMNPISQGGSPTPIHVSVGIPPSISMSAGIGGSDALSISGTTILSSKKDGGALIAGVLDWTGTFDDNRVTVAGVALNYKTIVKE